MDWKRIAPWNWFKHEQSRTSATPTSARADASAEPFATLRQEMEQLFDDSLRRWSAEFTPGAAIAGRGPTLLRPSVDIAEGKKAYTVRADLPGVELEDITLDVEGDTLLIRAEKRQESEEDNEGYHCVERSYGAMQRVLSLPEDADGESIEAKFKNGVLELRIPKQPARTPRGRSIEIQRS